MIISKTFGSSDDFSLKSMALIPRLLMVTKCLFTAMKVPSKKHSLLKESIHLLKKSICSLAKE